MRHPNFSLSAIDKFFFLVAWAFTSSPPPLRSSAVVVTQEITCLSLSIMSTDGFFKKYLFSLKSVMIIILFLRPGTLFLKQYCILCKWFIFGMYVERLGEDKDCFIIPYRLLAYVYTGKR